jgi:hypothetical protein
MRCVLRESHARKRDLEPNFLVVAPLAVGVGLIQFPGSPPYSILPYSSVRARVALRAPELVLVAC